MMSNLNDLFKIDADELRKRTLEYMRAYHVSIYKLAGKLGISYHTLTAFLRNERSQAFTTLSIIDSYLNKREFPGDRNDMV